MIKKLGLTALLLMTVGAKVYAQETTSVSQGTQAAAAPTYDFKNPEVILKTLKEQPEHISSALNLLHAVSEKDYAVVSRAYVRDKDYYYFISSAPETISSAVLIETKAGQYQRSLILAEDIAKFAAEALNNHPETYKDTPIEAYYQYAQKNIDAIRGVHIQNDEVAKQHQLLFTEAKDMEKFMIELFTQYIQQAEKPEVKMNEKVGEVYTYTIDEAASKKLLSLAEPMAKDNKMLTGFVNQLKKGYVGTLGFSVATGDIAMSVATVDGSEVIEFVLGMEESKLRQPDEGKVMTAEAFTKMVGTDLFQSDSE
ncbi:hypothetical protein I4Q36_01995 [Tuanshanicoccus lijuaniae]|uniref:hypothetical protein n=1 Tax=Aerococcaceae bacterium zg-1292 TaxID=2774330 RepID=UPI001938050B|nr:hypothetical protein [Aerococcaceae bacterium zg-1292]MBS4457004.1 hypothetical protein [Aerococcaceae bacterium zg-A91]MBS4458731.1 hypothetical protein [Aerococcaceae bacterium zg-BR33]QQA37511.1 hypothetical protein I4Q36_01995 [Aerococcaceae bacterium zg-1292]